MSNPGAVVQTRRGAALLGPCARAIAVSVVVKLNLANAEVVGWRHLWCPALGGWLGGRGQPVRWARPSRTGMSRVPVRTVVPGSVRVVPVSPRVAVAVQVTVTLTGRVPVVCQVQSR